MSRAVGLRVAHDTLPTRSSYPGGNRHERIALEAGKDGIRPGNLVGEDDGHRTAGAVIFEGG